MRSAVQICASAPDNLIFRSATNFFPSAGNPFVLLDKWTRDCKKFIASLKQIQMAVKKPFIKVQCSKCKTTNYFTKKSKATAEKKLEIKKFCSTCRKHTVHKEGKKG